MLYKSFIGFILILTVISCKSEYKFVLNSPKKIQSNQELTISISEKGNKPFDSIQFSINNQATYVRCIDGTGIPALPRECEIFKIFPGFPNQRISGIPLT